ncbi:MAG: Lrp/AsnC family transcriptional regulator [Methanobacteriota archaeon]|nr:MAG: Lrp/AsnC family transcriptional regulator [Euryarchaeota archaeon]
MVKAYIFIKCMAGDFEPVKKQIQAIPEITSCTRLMEAFDFVCTIEVQNSKMLRPIVTSKIRTIPEVIETMTIICVSP